MSEPRAQRTLVKSPPELWAEISDVSTLARHLGEFGEIRITDQKAETTIVWEGDTARGTVNLEPSGWGTRVTITAEAKEIEAEPVAEAEVVAEPVAEVEPEAVAEPEAEPAAAKPEPVAEVVAEPDPEPVAATTAPTPRRRGLFARLFGRRPEPEPEPVAETPTSVAPPAPTPTPTEAPAAEATPEPEPEPVAPVVAPSLEGEIVAEALLDDERIEAVLVGVLDDLGSAHHRPFSRG
jgi:hypothetical protein